MSRNPAFVSLARRRASVCILLALLIISVEAFRFAILKTGFYGYDLLLTVLAVGLMVCFSYNRKIAKEIEQEAKTKEWMKYDELLVKHGLVRDDIANLLRDERRQRGWLVALGRAVNREGGASR